jgi:diguanylate cyclase (GGDEF)-like protein
VGDQARTPIPATASDVRRLTTDAGAGDSADAAIDQALAGIDQRAADADQVASDVDQRASIADQARSDADQLTDDRVDSHGDDAGHERYLATRAIRAQASRERHATQLDRFRAADDRDLPAHDRDAGAARRDERAARRDLQAAALEDAIARRDPHAAGTMRTLRLQAARDRTAAARDRARAGVERRLAATERARLENELRTAHLDDLTGAYRRDMGWLAVAHEIDRARRGDRQFVLAFIDLDNLKGINDQQGHLAGDRALRAVVVAIRHHLRSFDPILRYGGDEFVAAMGGTAVADAEARFATIQDRLRESAGITISVGLAVLTDNDTIDDLTARADRDLYRRRGRLAVEPVQDPRSELTG